MPDAAPAYRDDGRFLSFCAAKAARSTERLQECVFDWCNYDYVLAPGSTREERIAKARHLIAQPDLESFLRSAEAEALRAQMQRAFESEVEEYNREYALYQTSTEHLDNLAYSAEIERTMETVNA